MEIMWSEPIYNLFKIGKSLEPIGIKNWAFTKEQCLFVLQNLLEMNIGILGGDVYRLDGSNIVPTYDNWYCEKMPNESYEEYKKRSINEGVQYIKDYASNDKKIFFTLVPLL